MNANLKVAMTLKTVFVSFSICNNDVIYDVIVSMQTLNFITTKSPVSISIHLIN